MTLLVILLRIIHLFCGIFWAGYAMFNLGFLAPTIRATGMEGQQVMRHLTQKTRFLAIAYLASTLTVLSGIFLFWLSVGFRKEAILSGKGHVLLLGGITGILAWLIVLFPVRNIFQGMKAATQEIQAQGAPPRPEQAARMQAYVARLMKNSKIALVFLVITILAMAMARYMV